MPLQHDAFERRASAQTAVRNQLKHTRYSLEFRPKEHVGLVSGRIRRWITKAFYIFKISKADHKFQHEFNVKLHQGWQNLTVTCQDFGRWFRRHWLIGPVSRMYYTIS